MTRKPFQHRTDAELEFIISDCNAAISANPESENVYRYLAERQKARAELNARQMKRTRRQQLHRYLFDPLAATYGNVHPSRWRKRWGNNTGWNGNADYARDQWRTAAWLLGYDRKGEV